MKFSDDALTLDAYGNLSSIQSVDKSTPPPEPLEFSAGEKFMAGQMKYNMAVRGPLELTNLLTNQYEDVEGYSPYNDLEEIAGYPPHIFINSQSPLETTYIKGNYDRDHYLERVTSESGFTGIASSVGGGFMNPLYLFPYLRIGHNLRTVKGAADAAIGEVITEGLYHGADLDYTRTAAESIFNVAAASTVGGILGRVQGTGRALDPDQLKQVETNMKREMEFVGPVQPPEVRIAQMKPVESLKDMEIEQLTGWMKTRLAGLTPLRMLTSPNPRARAAAALLGEQTVVGTHRAAVETLIKSYDTHLGTALHEANAMWKQYKSLAHGSKMTRLQFLEETVNAMRAGDVHQIKEVEAAAKKIRRELMDVVRGKAKEVGIYKSDADVARFAEGYFPRMYNFDKITRELGDFKRDLASYFRKEYPEFEPEDIMAAADEVASKIRHTYDGQNVLSAEQEFKANALKGRTVSVPDEVLKKWLINDPELVLRAWSHNMATQIELTRQFGTTDLSKYRQEIEDEWEKIITKASDENSHLADKFQKRKNDDMAVFDALVDRIKNRYKLPDNPTSGWVRAARTARNLNVLRLLGGMTLSAFPDLARPLYHHGMGRYAKAMHALTTDSAFRNMALADARRAGVAMEMVLNQRMRAWSELDYIPNIGRGGYLASAENAIERLVLGRGGGGWDFGRVSLMSPWNNTMKFLTFTMGQDGLIRHLNKNVKYAKKLQQAGISPEMVQRMKQQLAKYGDESSGLKLSNLDKWDDYLAAELFENTLLREVDATIITPGILDKPLWTSTEFGKVLGQFKSFAFAATNKQFLAGANNMDAMFFQGMLAASTLGAMTWSMKQVIAGKDPNDTTPEELLMKGIEYSGVIGFGSELIGLGMGMANAAGIYKGDGNYRWAKQGLIGQLGGPTLGLGEDAFRGMRYFFKDEPNGGDIEALRRTMPYNNLLYLRWLFDEVEDMEKARAGVRER